jgi:hypothetical protein
MGWWSEQCNEVTKVLITAGRARQHHQQCKEYQKERDHRSGSDGLSEYFGAFTLFTNDDARCGLKPMRLRLRVFFTEDRMRHEISEEPARRDSTLVNFKVEMY